MFTARPLLVPAGDWIGMVVTVARLRPVRGV